jgi:hypothetical protein
MEKRVAAGIAQQPPAEIKTAGEERKQQYLACGKMHVLFIARFTPCANKKAWQFPARPSFLELFYEY